MKKIASRIADLESEVKELKHKRRNCVTGCPKWWSVQNAIARAEGEIKGLKFAKKLLDQGD